MILLQSGESRRTSNARGLSSAIIRAALPGHVVGDRIKHRTPGAFCEKQQTMNPILILIATSAFGMDVGWEPLPEGGHEYTIELDPQVLEQLGAGEEVVGKVPPDIDVRSYRIFVGTEKLVRHGGNPRQVARPATPEPSTEESDVTRPRQPQSEEQLAPQPEMSDERATFEEPSTVPPVLEQGSDESASALGAPARLPDEAAQSNPVQADESHRVQAASFSKPASEPQSASEAVVKLIEDRPWVALLVVAIMLCCSLAANFYLGWIAWDARSRYRATLAKVRSMPVT
jgi:hypothetical protein